MSWMWLVDGAKLLAPIVGLAASCWTLINTARLLVSARRREELENEEITIIISSLNTELELPYKPRRKSLNRAELMGIIGMFSLNGRFTLSMLTVEFVHGEFSNVMVGKTSVLRITATEEEMKQFISPKGE